MKAHALPAQDAHLGFQIAPMIDVVFVIMLFFMVMAGAIKAERLLSSTLPGKVPQDSGCPSSMVTIAISEDGEVTMNDEVYDGVTTRDLPMLRDSLTRLSRDAQSRGSIELVLVQAEARASYQRIVDVMNVLAKAKLSHVTFTIGDAE